jgi:hypothetical protein
MTKINRVFTLDAAIARHMRASAAVEAHEGPDDVPPALVDAETAALDALARTPCADDGAFFRKVAYMLSVQKAAYGPGWGGSIALEILAALDLHLSAGKRAGEGERSTPSKAAEIPEGHEDRDAEYLHWPGRRRQLLTLDEHLASASSLARALWLATDDVDLADPRNAAALRALASEVADHTSAAEYVLATRERRQ